MREGGSVAERNFLAHAERRSVLRRDQLRLVRRLTVLGRDWIDRVSANDTEIVPPCYVSACLS